MKTSEIKDTSLRIFKKGAMKVKKHSPEILLFTGVAAGLAGAVTACKATTKIDTVIDPAFEQLEKIRTYVEDKGYSDEYSHGDEVKDKTIIYTQLGIGMLKLYWPSLILGLTGVTCIFASHNVMKKRNAALVAAYNIVDGSFKTYRNRVVERFGEEIDKELRFGVKEQKFEEVTTDSNGKEKKITKKVNVIEKDKGLEDYSDYAKFFDASSPYWEKDSEYNLMFLKAQQQYANDRLHADGYIFLNDVYDMLGIPRTRAGQIVGWYYDPENENTDNYVDFGIYDINRETVRDFVNGYERVIILDFNVDGPIIDKI